MSAPLQFASASSDARVAASRRGVADRLVEYTFEYDTSVWSALTLHSDFASPPRFDGRQKRRRGTEHAQHFPTRLIPTEHALCVAQPTLTQLLPQVSKHGAQSVTQIWQERFRLRVQSSFSSLASHAPQQRLTSDGQLDVWLNGTRVFSRSGSNCFNDFGAPFAKFGIYKYPWKTKPSPSSPGGGVLVRT